MQAGENTIQQAAQGSAESHLPPLPRINVHMFCATPEVARAMQEAAADRHLFRTHAVVSEGGIEAAVRAYAETATPDVLVVESAAPREELFGELARLAEVCTVDTKVVVIGHINDITLYRQLLAEGVHDYLTAPLHATQLVQSLAMLFVDAPAEKLGRVLVFMGAKGGVGASIIAHHVAWELAERHAINTVLADLDLAFGTAGLDLGQDPVQGIVDALLATDRLDEVFLDRLLHKCSEHLLLLAAPSAVDKAVDIEAEALDLVLDALRATTPLTVLDMPSNWEGWMKVPLMHADDIVIVSSPELAALRNVKSLVDNIRALRSGREGQPLLVVNQVGMGKRPEIPAEKFEELTGLEIAASIPFDEKSFGQAATESRMLFEVAPKSEAARLLVALADRLSGRPPVSEKKGGSLLAPLLGRLWGRKSDASD